MDYTTSPSTASLANDVQIRCSALGRTAPPPAHRGPCTEGTPVPGRLVDEDGLRGLPLAQRTGQGQSGVVAFLMWELVRLQEPLNRRRREDGLNSSHIFLVKSATACTEVTVTGKMSIGPPKDRCGRILEACRLRAKDLHFV